VRPNPFSPNVTLSIVYRKRNEFRNEFRENFSISELPVRLTRKLLRLGCSDELMALLQVTYEEMLLEALRCVPHGDLHTDNEGYDL
jgi:hypothetical protein